MKHRQLRQVTAPSSGGLGQCRDIILIRTRRDLANAGPLIRRESPDARFFSRDIQKYFGFGQSRSMQRPNLVVARIYEEAVCTVAIPPKLITMIRLGQCFFLTT